jgi:hypothetical protein
VTSVENIDAAQRRKQGKSESEIVAEISKLNNFSFIQFEVTFELGNFGHHSDCGSESQIFLFPNFPRSWVLRVSGLKIIAQIYLHFPIRLLVMVSK